MSASENTTAVPAAVPRTSLKRHYTSMVNILVYRPHIDILHRRPCCRSSPCHASCAWMMTNPGRVCVISHEGRSSPLKRSGRRSDQYLSGLRDKGKSEGGGQACLSRAQRSCAARAHSALKDLPGHSGFRVQGSGFRVQGSGCRV
jgi:hypothetical protein